MRKTVAALIMALLITAAAGILLVNPAMANPFTNSQYSGSTGAPAGAPSPTVSILYPEDNNAYNTDSITLNFNTSVEQISETSPHQVAVRGMRIIESFFTADWLPNETKIEIAPFLNAEGSSNNASVSLNLTGVPDGKHTLRVYVLAKGSIIDPFHWYDFNSVGFSRVNFTVDTSPPSISVSQTSNETHVQFEPLEVPLNFIINEPAMKISYVLDGMKNVTINGNTTLSGLSYGKHSLTVYAWDVAGNVGASETVTLTVVKPETFPAVPVVAVSTVSISFAAVVLLIYFRKRKY